MFINLPQTMRVDAQQQKNINNLRKEARSSPKRKEELVKTRCTGRMKNIYQSLKKMY